MMTISRLSRADNAIKESTCLAVTVLLFFLVISGCAEFDAWSKRYAASLEAQQGSESDSALSTDPAPTIDDVQKAVSQAHQFLQEREQHVEELFNARAQLEQDMRELREQELPSVNNELEVLRQQLQTVRESLETTEEDRRNQWKTMTTTVDSHESAIKSQQEQFAALVDQVSQDQQMYVDNLQDFRDSLLTFQEALTTLDTGLIQEAQRASDKEEVLAKQLAGHGTRLDRVMKGQGTLKAVKKRLNQLHAYMNDVRKTFSNEAKAINTSLEGLKQEMANALPSSSKPSAAQAELSPSIDTIAASSPTPK